LGILTNLQIQRGARFSNGIASPQHSSHRFVRNNEVTHVIARRRHDKVGTCCRSNPPLRRCRTL